MSKNKLPKIKPMPTIDETREYKYKYMGHSITKVCSTNKTIDYVCNMSEKIETQYVHDIDVLDKIYNVRNMVSMIKQQIEGDNKLNNNHKKTIMANGTDSSEQTTAKTTPMGEETTSSIDMVAMLKLVGVSLAAIALAYFWPITMFFLWLPKVMYYYAFPPRLVGTTPVSWFGKLFGRKGSPIYATPGKLVRYVLNAINFVWWVAVLALVVWGLVKLFKKHARS